LGTLIVTRRKFIDSLAAGAAGLAHEVVSINPSGTEIYSAVQHGKSGRNGVKRSSVEYDRVLQKYRQIILKNDFMLSYSGFLGRIRA
jgi:hypothetical protein